MTSRIAVNFGVILLSRLLILSYRKQIVPELDSLGMNIRHLFCEIQLLLRGPAQMLEY